MPAPRLRSRLTLGLLLAALAVGCGIAAPADVAAPASTAATAAPAQASGQPSDGATPEVLEPSEPFGRTTVVLRSPDGATTIDVPAYDAFDEAMRRRGLMQREQLPESAGMVFRFPGDRNGGFWMRNTLIPLSIAYFAADGEIVRILDMEPCTTMTCPSYPPEAVYRGALEVNQGFFAEHRVAAGWYVDVPPDLPPPS